MKRVLAGIAAIAAAVAFAPGTAGAQDDTQITILHGIPGVPVDIAQAGTVLLPNFEPGATQDVTGFAGNSLTDLEIRAAGTTDVLIGPTTVDVPASGNWTLLAHLDADGNPTLTSFENDASPTADGQGRLTIRHAAAAPAVDVVLGDVRPVEGAENGDEAVLDLPAGEISGAQIAPAGGDPIADVPTVNLTAGTNLIVYAVGSLDDDTFDFYTQEIEVGTEAAAEDTGEGTAEDTGDGGADDGDGTPAPTSVNTGNPITDSTNVALLASAAGLFVLAGSAMALRRRTIDR